MGTKSAGNDGKVQNRKMKQLCITIFLLMSSRIIFAQDINIPEAIITGEDKSTYKTPILPYSHEIYIKFPETKKVPEQYIKFKTIPQQQKNIEQSQQEKKNFYEFSFFAGKFGYTGSVFSLKSFQWDGYFSAVNDNSFRSHDRTVIFQTNIKKPITENLFLDFDYYNCLKEIPQIDLSSARRKKHTVMAGTDLFFKNDMFEVNTVIEKNTLSKLEELNEYVKVKKFCGDFVVGGEIGYNSFAGKGNRILELSGTYRKEHFQTDLALKTIGQQTKILPSAYFLIEKQDTKLLFGASSNFSFFEFSKDIAESPYLEMKNVFLQPEENYSIFSEVSWNTVGIQFKIKALAGYESVAYQWQDPDNDNIYQPVVLKDNAFTMLNINITKKLEAFYIEGDYTSFNRDKTKSGFPDDTGYIRAGFNAGKFKPEFELKYTGKQIFGTKKIGSYTIFSSLISYDISKDVKMFFKFNNIFGTSYQEAPLFKGRPFEFIAGFQTKW